MASHQMLSLIHILIFEMRGDRVAVGVVRRVLYGAEVLDIHVVRHDDEAAGMLARRASHADAARRLSLIHI